MLHLAVSTLTAGPGAVTDILNPELVIDALWAVAVPVDHVEHISSVSKSGQTAVGLYVRATNQTDADLAARSLVGRAARTVPLLSGWYLQAPETAGSMTSPLAGLAALWPLPGAPEASPSDDL